MNVNSIGRTAKQMTGPVVTIAAVTGILSIVLVSGSSSPGPRLSAFFLGPFTNWLYVSNLLDNAALLILTGLGVSLAFHSGNFNLGGEGQVFAGGIAVAALGQMTGVLPPFVGILVLMVTGMCVGAILAGTSGYLKIKWKTDELITTYLFSMAAIHAGLFLIKGPLSDPESYLITTRMIPRAFHIPVLVPPSHLSIISFVPVLLAAAVFFLLYRTAKGYELRMSGSLRRFARYGGIPVNSLTVAAMVISGAFHGLAGSITVLSNHHMAMEGFSAGMGWNGIAVALIASNHPLGVIAAALVFSYLQKAVETAVLLSDFDLDLNLLLQALVFLFITAKLSPRVVGFIKKCIPVKADRDV